MIMPVKKDPMKKDPAQKSGPAAADLNINKANEWAQVQNEWMKVQMEKAQARADKFFTTDEEMPLGAHLLLVAMAGFIVFFILWANFATLDEVTRGDGKVIPSSEVQIIQNLEGGIVDEFLVKEGDSVTAGQIVMRLRNIDASSNLGSNQSKYLGLLATVSRLKAEAEGKPTPEFPEEVMKGAPQSVTEQLENFKANMQSLNSQTQVFQQQLIQREQEVRELNSRVSDIRSVLSLSRQERDMIAPLVERGSAPKVELIQLERGLREKEGELNGLLTALPRSQAAVQEAKAKIEDRTTFSHIKTRKELKTIRGRVYFVSKGITGGSSLPPGIWAKSGTHGAEVKPVLMFVRRATYVQRIDLDRVVERADLQSYLDRRIRYRIRKVAGE